MAMMRRSRFLAAVDAGLRLSPVTSTLGPCQCGKTSLALEIARQYRATYFDLEDPEDHEAEPRNAFEAVQGAVTPSVTLSRNAGC